MKIGDPVYINEASHGCDPRYTLAKVEKISPKGNTVTVINRNGDKRVFINGKEKGRTSSWRTAWLECDVERISKFISGRNKTRAVSVALNKVAVLEQVRLWDDESMRNRINELRKIADAAEAILDGKVETGS